MKKLNKTTKIENFCRLRNPLKMSKKAQFFNILLVFATVAILLTVYSNIRIKQIPFPRGIGANQLGLINTYYEAEKDLLYIDIAAKLAAQQAIHQLTITGGIDPTLCQNQFLGHPLLTDCDLEYEEYFNKLFKQEFKKYSAEEHSLLINGPNLIGTSYNDSLIVVGAEGEKKGDIAYWFRKSFNIDIGYDLEKEYTVFLIDANNLIQQCKDQPNLQECLKTLPEGWVFGDCIGAKTVLNRNAAFCVTSKQRLLTTTGYEPVIYQFALHFPEPETKSEPEE